jgi:two-component system KDP operon response regulator KdpE
MNSLATRVLVVDDEPAIRRLLRGSLARAGHDVIEAADARAALAALAIDKPDLVLLDLGLPDRDGLELIPLVKATGAALLIVSARDATDEKLPRSIWGRTIMSPNPSIPRKSTPACGLRCAAG